MNIELKTKWVEALRSDKFKQFRGSIGGYQGKPDTLCCIGVGGRVAGLQDVGIAGTKVTRDCADALGLSEDEYEKLWRMNDDEGKSFAEIADYIEANL